MATETDKNEGDEERDDEHDGLDEQMRRARAVAEAFSPAAPVNRRNLFAGRVKQMATLLNVVSGRGEHAVIYGERGVGKTSLASVVARLVRGPERIAVRVNCDSSDTYGSIWHKVLWKNKTMYAIPGVGFAADDREIIVSAADSLPDEPKPHDVETVLGLLTRSGSVAVFLDEFDRVQNPAVSHWITNTVERCPIGGSTRPWSRRGRR